jgi:tRNA modification GTPase
VRRALERARRADLVVWLSPADAPEAPPDDLGPGELEIVISKADLAFGGPRQAGIGLPVSAATGEGLAALVSLLQARAEARLGGGSALASRARQRRLLEEAVAALDRAAGTEGLALELRAEEVRTALLRLGELTGRVDVEQLLDVIFSEFCIGK